MLEEGSADGTLFAASGAPPARRIAEAHDGTRLGAGDAVATLQRRERVTRPHVASVSMRRTVVPCSLPLTTTVRAASPRLATMALAGAGWSVQPKAGKAVW